MNIPDIVKHQNMSRQERLKANIYTGHIQLFVADLRDKWQPQTKEVDAPDGQKFKMYFDEYHCVWTTEDMAFKGYVFKKVTSIINRKQPK